MYDYLVVFHLQKLCTLGAHLFRNFEFAPNYINIGGIWWHFGGILVAFGGIPWHVHDFSKGRKNIKL